MTFNINLPGIPALYITYTALQHEVQRLRKDQHQDMELGIPSFDYYEKLIGGLLITLDQLKPEMDKISYDEIYNSLVG